jgi:hypothetical protein
VLDGGDGDNRLFAGAGSDLVGGSSSSPEGEVTGGDDLLYLGADRDADWAFFYQAVDFPQDTWNLFIGSDTVRNFDPARDTLDIQSFDSFGELFVVDVRDFLDSNDDGQVTAADREVSRSGGDLVLDLAALLNRAADVRDPGGPPAFEDVSITLEGIGGGFAAARVAPFDTSLTDAIIRTVVREDGEFPL